MLRQEIQKRTIWLNETEQIASFHFVDGYRQEDFTCYDIFISFIQTLQIRGYRFQ